MVIFVRADYHWFQSQEERSPQCQQLGKEVQTVLLIASWYWSHQVEQNTNTRDNNTLLRYRGDRARPASIVGGVLRWSTIFFLRSTLHHSCAKVIFFIPPSSGVGMVGVLLWDWNQWSSALTKITMIFQVLMFCGERTGLSLSCEWCMLLRWSWNGPWKLKIEKEKRKFFSFSKISYWF